MTVGDSRAVRVWFGRIALALWFGGVLAIGAGLLARHLVPLPAPPLADLKLGPSLSELRTARNDGWFAVHVLYAECACSHRIADHLIHSRRPSGWEEVVLWVGSSEPPPDLQRSLRVKNLTRSELSHYGVESAPLLVALDPSGSVRYSGGYTDRKQGPIVEDVRILTETARAESVVSLPVLGCAVSDRLKAFLGRLPGFEAMR